jgi:hypothetical protein
MDRSVFAWCSECQFSSLVEDAQVQQVEASATVHLALDQLETMDVPFLTPGQLEGCFNCISISGQVVGEAGLRRRLRGLDHGVRAARSRCRMSRKNSLASSAAAQTSGDAS